MLWVLGLAKIAGMFPYTRWLQDWLLTKVSLLVQFSDYPPFPPYKRGVNCPNCRKSRKSKV